ncbi:MAG: glycosyltransferase family 39 protein [Calditrichaceae bacterium]|nr:glycosyltransferase family 39 protein [Calditrichaceae bacterium]
MRIRNFNKTGLWLLICLIAIIKLLIHLMTSENYELQRDAYLYIAQAHHLDFGYISIPPLLPFLIRIMEFIFGDSVLAMRLLPAIIGALSIIIIGKFALDAGGKTWAVLIACLAFSFSPAFLRSNSLLQPVSLNQFFWLLSSYFIFKLLQTKDTKYWIHIGIIWGIGFLNKYSIVFLSLAFILGILVTPQRQFLRSRHFLYGMGIGFLIILPNLVWQHMHNWPVVSHMAELYKNQLVNVHIIDFISMQFLMNMPGVLIWIAGLVYFLFLREVKHYRALGFAYFFLILILILFRGKAYYTLGIYSMLFVGGGLFLEKYLTGYKVIFNYIVLVLMACATLIMLPFSLPVYPLEKMAQFSGEAVKFGMEGALRWEDGQLHAIPQDYADMTGWKELSDIVLATYNRLSEEEKSQCVIYAENYGQAGAVRYHTHKSGLPEPISFSDSFVLWAPEKITLQVFIYINDDPSEMYRFFGEMVEAGRVINPYFRENGIAVYLCKHPKDEFISFARNKIKEHKSRYLQE